MRIALLTAAALVCFAANSILCRLALAHGAIDPAGFTGLRMASGALVLGLIALRRSGARAAESWSWWSAAALLAYAAPFSYAYVSLGAGVGALVLFAVVQATMIGWGVARGDRPRPPVWLGLAIAMSGLVGLAAPGASAPDPIGVAMMAIAGAAWAAYTLRGRASAIDPVVANAASFARTVPAAAVLVAAAAIAGQLAPSPRGAALAITSGAVASGVGYALWYAALRGLTVARAAILQLLVPVIAAAGGVMLLGETATLRLLLAGAAILGGVAIAVVGRS
ncbi:MAG TPA: DMT family transporter [Kofleriaceae bacterium]|jgi:drug/metabolite transporter (DMT)-like permease